MSLSRHVDADALMEAAADHPHLNLVERTNESRLSHDRGGRYRIDKLPKYTVPKEGCTGQEAYNIINNELTLDGRPTLNLASFVHVSVPDECRRLLNEQAQINLVDQVYFQRRAPFFLLEADSDDVASGRIPCYAGHPRPLRLDARRPVEGGSFN